MSSVVVTVLLLIVVIVVLGGLVFSARREHQLHKRMLAYRASALAPLHPQVSSVRYLQDGATVDLAELKQSTPFLLPSSSGYMRRMFVSLAFLTMILLTLFTQRSLATGNLHMVSNGSGLTLLRYSQPAKVHPILHPLTASKRLVRLDSTARSQYHTDYQWQVWSYSSCSGMAMATVMNAYGRHLIGADVLQVELNLGVWGVNLGLLREEGIAMTAAHFGFNTQVSHSHTLQDLIAISNKGAPVIVGVRDNYYFPGGHIFVVRGGNSHDVYVVDSSPENFQRMSYRMFLGMWQGFSAVLTPRSAQ